MSQVAAGGSNSKLGDFDLGRTLGEGSYSSVVEAIYRLSGKAYALKILDKRHIVKEKKVKYVHVEKEALNLLADCPSVIRLHWTFQDQQSLYFVLDLVERGEILTFIKQLGSFSSECIRFYGAELLQAIDCLHEKNCIHRDLKPENILLDAEWHIKLADFGSAKIFKSSLATDTPGLTTPSPTAGEIMEERANSFVGTAEYVSPELLNEKAASKESDLWAYGCILYQMACGRPPFKASNDYQIFQKILRLDYSFPDGFQDRQLCDLIGKLLVLEPANRLTSAQIKQHPFFTSVDWSTALCQQQPPSLQLGQYKRNNLQQRTSGSSSGGGGGGDGGFEGEISSNSENIEGSGSLDAAESVNSGRISDIALQDEDRWRSYLQSEEIIVHAGVLIKWRKLFPKRRFFILTDRPRLIYINPRTGEQKGVIQLTGREARVQLKDSKNFLIHTPGRTYVLEDPEGEAKYWCETISARLPM